MGEFDTDGTIKRDERLRRRLLEVLHRCRGFAPEGGLSGVRLLDEVSEERDFPTDQAITDERHFLALLKDLENLGLVTIRQQTRRRYEGFRADHVFVCVTALGSQLIDEHVAPVKGVYDERI